ncbi:hypothetical protein Tco_1298764 [Tanacetum coccineum]
MDMILSNVSKEVVDIVENVGSATPAQFTKMECGGGEVCNYEFGSEGSEMEGDCLANATKAARDDCYAVVEWPLLGS